MSNLLNGITGILVAVAPNYTCLLIFRLLFGFGVKSGWMAGYVLSEFPDLMDFDESCRFL